MAESVVELIVQAREERPHEALGNDTPASHYKPSGRSFPEKLPELEYPDHFRVQRVQHNGVISVDGVQFYISNCVEEEYIGLEAVSDDCWKVYFGPIELGLLDPRRAKPLCNRRLFGVLVRSDGTQRRFYGRAVTRA